MRTRLLKRAGRIEHSLPGATGRAIRYRVPRVGPPTEEQLAHDARREQEERLRAKGPQAALTLIREHGPLSTAEIAKLASRSQTIAREWVKPLEDAGLVIAIDERLTKAEGWRRRRYALPDEQPSLITPSP